MSVDLIDPYPSLFSHIVLEAAEQIFPQEIHFYGRLNHSVVDVRIWLNISSCFHTIFFCHIARVKPIALHSSERLEQEPGLNASHGRLISMKEYDNPTLMTREIQQASSAVEYTGKIDFHNDDMCANDCLVDKDFNLMLAEFD